jgi:hypothetical protein
MLPEVQEYMDAVKASDEVYQEWYRRINKERPDYHHVTYTHDAYERWNERYYAEQRAQDDVRRNARTAASVRLQETTTDPAIQWMLKTLRGYHSYIDTVLPILPATREQLEAVANEHEWCNDFDDFMDQATEAGIIPPRDGKWDASDIVSFIAEEYDVNSRSVRRRVQAMVDQIVTKALAAEKEKEATEELVAVS